MYAELNKSAQKHHRVTTVELANDSLKVEKSDSAFFKNNLRKIVYAYFMAVSENKPMLVSRYLDPLLSRTLQTHTQIISRMSSNLQNLKFRVISLSDKSGDVQIQFKNLLGNEMAIELTIVLNEEGELVITRAGFGL